MDLLRENMIQNADKSKGFLIDGYPREVIQAKKFEETVCFSMQIDKKKQKKFCYYLDRTMYTCFICQSK